MTFAAVLLGRACWVWGISLVLWELVARIGAGLLPAFGIKRPGALGRFGFGILLGWQAIGIAYLGLALAGLFHPLVLVAVAGGLALLSRAMREPRILAREAVTEILGYGREWCALPVLLLPVILLMLLPETGHDSWLYHLGLPWQYLMAGRATFDNVWFAPYHVPAPFEMAYALPLVLGDDRLAKGVVLSCFLAASAVFAWFVTGEGNTESSGPGGTQTLPASTASAARGASMASFAGPAGLMAASPALLAMLPLGSTLMLSLIVTCKNDVPASALFVSGALLTLSGRRSQRMPGRGGERSSRAIRSGSLGERSSPHANAGLDAGGERSSPKVKVGGGFDPGVAGPVGTRAADSVGPVGDERRQLPLPQGQRWPGRASAADSVGPGFLFLGLAAGAKFVYWPLVGAWFLFFFPFDRSKSLARRIRIAPVLLLPILAPSLLWWAKEWLATGNPVWPFGSRIFPSLGWGEDSRKAFDSVVDALLPHGIPRWPSVPAELFAALRRIHLPVLLLLPVLLVIPRDTRMRRAGWACLAGSVLVLGLAGFERYLLPATWLLALLTGRELGRYFAGAVGPVIFQALVVGYVAAGVFLNSEYLASRWADLGRPWAVVRSNALTRFVDVERILLDGNPRPPRWRPGAPRPPRVLSVGEWRTYGFPARILFNGMFAEAPLVWSAAREARDVPGVARRMRQYGAGLVMLNYLTVEWQETAYTPFRWKRGSLRRWVEYCKRYLEFAGSSAGLDNLNGGFHVFRVLARPRSRPLAAVWFAPGTETAFAPDRPGYFRARAQEALPDYLEVFAMMPDVAHAWNQVGHMFSILEDVPNASRYLREFGETGVQDRTNLDDLAAVAMRMGELELADRIIARALPLCPDSRPELLQNRASLCVQLAIQAVEAGNIARALERCDAGLSALAEVPAGADMVNADRRRAARAILLGIKGEALSDSGHRAEGLPLLDLALQLAPDSPPAPRWRRRLAARSPSGKR